MFNNIENQIVRQALKLPDLKTNQAKKLESILDQAYRALQNKQPELARRILQSGGALEETDSQANKLQTEKDKLLTEKKQEESKPNPNKAKINMLAARLRNQDTLIAEAQKTNLVAKPSVTIKSTVTTKPETTKKPEDMPPIDTQDKAKSDETQPAKPKDEFAWVSELPEPEKIELPKSKSIAGPTKSIEYIKRNFKNCLKDKDALVPIPPDNHCMFTAFGYSLMRTLGQTHDQALAWANDNKMKLRAIATYYVCNPTFGRTDPDDSLRERKIETFEGPCPEDKNIKDIKSYCTLFKGSKCWGDAPELTALLKYFKKDALLYQYREDAPVTLMGINDEVFKDKTDEEIGKIEINPRELIYLVYDGRHYETFNPDILYERPPIKK